MGNRRIKTLVVASIFALTGIMISGCYEQVYAQTVSENRLEEEVKAEGFSVIETEEVSAEKAGSSFITATSISTNTQYQGKMIGLTQKEYYKFTLPEDGVVSLTISHELYESANYAWYMDIYNSSQKRIDTTKASNGYTKSKTGSSIGLSAGTYYIIVTGCSQYTDRVYTFEVNYEATDYWEKEFNDSWITATPILTDATYYGCISYWDSCDFYSLSLAEPGTICFELSHELYETAYSGWAMELYRENGASFERMYEIKSTNGYSETKEGVRIGLESGTYYIVIREKEDDQDRTYSFRVNYDTWEYDSELEENDSWLTANEIDTYELYFGSTMSNEDVDYYRFYSPVSAYSNIRFEYGVRDNQECKWMIEIYDEDRTLNSRFNLYSGNNNGTFLSTNLSKGYHYLVIRQAGSNEGNEYSFELQLQHKKGTTVILDDGFKYKVNKLCTQTSSGEVELVGPITRSITSARIENAVYIGNFKYNVTKIRSSAFKNCKKLKKVVIGSKVKTIGSKAFYNCKKLKYVTIKSKRISKVGKNALRGINKNAKIRFPKSKYSKYSKLFANKGQPKTVIFK